MKRVRRTLLCLFLVLPLLGIAVLSRWVGKRAAFAQIRSVGPRIARYIRFNESGTRSSGGSVIGSGGSTGFDAVRSDGATVHGRYLLRPDGKTYLVRRILFPQSGRNVVVMDDIRSITTTTLPENHPDRLGTLLPDPQKDCTGLRFGTVGSNTTETVKEHSFYENTPVVVVERFTAGEAKYTEWRAPSFDCYALRSIMELKEQKTGDVFKTERVAIGIQQGEPPSELFDVPNWQERSPISSEETYLRNFKNGVINPDLYPAFAGQEKRYNERHKQ